MDERHRPPLAVPFLQVYIGHLTRHRSESQRNSQTKQPQRHFDGG